MTTRMLALIINFLFATLSAAMGAIFGMATCLSAQARDAPDHPTNYFIGGCASGIFLGARSKYSIHVLFIIILGHWFLFFCDGRI